MTAPADSYSVNSGVTIYGGRAAPGGGGGGGASDIMTVRPAPGVLKSVHLNDLTSVNACPGNGCWYTGTTGQNGPWMNWNGAVFAPEYSTHGAMLYWGGGHGGYDGGELYLFDLSTRQWLCLGSNPPFDFLPSLDATWVDFLWNDSYIVPATHTYGGVLYIKPSLEGNAKGSWLLPNIGFGPLSPGLPQGHQMPHSMDLVTGVMKRATTNTLNLAGSNGYGGSFVDTTRNIAWYTGGTDSTDVGRIDLNVAPASRTITRVTSFTTGGWYCTTRYVPSKDIAVSLWCDYGQTTVRLRMLDLSSGTPVDMATPPIDAHTMRGSGFGFDYCPDTGKFYCYEGYGSTTVHVLTPPANWHSTATAWTWSTETMAGEVPIAMTEIYPASQGGDAPYSKWTYNPIVKCFMWSQGTTTRVCTDGVSRPGAFQLYRPLGT